MKIAAITITYNDDYKFNKWFQCYIEYKDELFLHIIVDNNSNKEYLNKVKATFIESHVIERNSNGGWTILDCDNSKVLENKEIKSMIFNVNDNVKKVEYTGRLF